MPEQRESHDEDAPAYCFHCREPIPPGTRIHARIRQRDEAMCCEGCRAVAELIAAAGLQDYYQYRNQPALKPEQKDQQDEWQVYAQSQIAAQYVRSDSAALCSATILVDGIRCAACAWLIDRMLRRDDQIRNVNVNVATARVNVTWQGEQSYFGSVLRSLSKLGYRPHAIDSESIQQQADNERRSMLKRLGVAGVGMMQVMMYVLPMYVHSDMDSSVRHYLQLVGLLLTTPVLLYAGWPFLESAAHALRLRAINMDVPVALALLLAYGVSVINTLLRHGETYFDSICMFIFLLTLARFVVMTVRHRSHGVADALVRIQPRVAHRVRQQGVADVSINQLEINDVVLVRAGETVPVDGIIIAGCSRLDESLLTGESLPVERNESQKVIAGSINVSAPLQVRVTGIGQHTVLSGMLALLEQVQSSRPRAISLADHISRRFLMALLLITAAVAATWWLIDASRVLDIVLAVLVVTCPCALSLATPAVIASTTTALARRGLLITHADAIEQLAHVEMMAFDKTGTLTTGKIDIADIKTAGTLNAQQCRDIAAALEQAVDHPVARALSMSSIHLVTSNVQITPGAGVEGVINGMTYRLGTAAYVHALNGRRTGEDGASIWLGDTNGVLACFTLSDTPRQDASTAIEQLKALNIKLLLLSGDALSAVQSVAHACGIADYRARQSPTDKVQTLQHYQQHSMIAMVGDGINDAPVLGAASVSIAMGAGTAVAQASADAVLMNNSLQTLPQAIKISRKAHQIMKQNFWWAAIYNLGAVPLAAMGYISPWMAAAGMSASSVLVVLNAARVLRSEPTS